MNNLTRAQERLSTPSMECECGAMYSQTDGGPCHLRCAYCNALRPAEEIDEYDVCDSCRNTLKEEKLEDMRRDAEDMRIEQKNEDCPECGAVLEADGRCSQRGNH